MADLGRHLLEEDEVLVLVVNGIRVELSLPEKIKKGKSRNFCNPHSVKIIPSTRYIAYDIQIDFHPVLEK